ncbi:MAG: tetratricopeptide repeat protein [Sphingobium sp.]
MLKVAAIIGLALVATTPGVALAAPDEVLVVGVPDGGLAANALMSGDFQKAANKLKAPTPDGANDPARLINLGNAYAGMGRMADARDAYKAARFAPETLLVLANGSEESSRDIARRAMGRLEASYAMR